MSHILPIVFFMQLKKHTFISTVLRGNVFNGKELWKAKQQWKSGKIGMHKCDNHDFSCQGQDVFIISIR